MSATDPVHMPAGQAGRDGESRIRVMVVDDSLTARTVLCKIIDRADDLVLTATANSAEQAMLRLEKVAVDVILLDLEMPGMGGIAGLPGIMERADGAQVLVVSALTAEGAEETVEALAMGAADTVQKPLPGKFDTAYREDLANRIRALAGRAQPADGIAHFVPPAPQPATRKAPRAAIRCVAIGGSTGGIHSLFRFFGKLPRSFEPAIAVTQHLPKSFVPIFASQVEQASGRTARIAADGLELVAGEVLIAPGDGHMAFEKRGNRVFVKIMRHTVVSGCCPSVDPMLDSLAHALDGDVVGVMLSGMGRDGSIGATTLVDKGGIMLAEARETCAVWGMPRGVAEAGLASHIAAPEDLAAWIATRMMVSQ